MLVLFMTPSELWPLWLLATAAAVPVHVGETSLLQKHESRSALMRHQRKGVDTWKSRLEGVSTELLAQSIPESKEKTMDDLGFNNAVKELRRQRPGVVGLPEDEAKHMRARMQSNFEELMDDLGFNNAAKEIRRQRPGVVGLPEDVAEHMRARMQNNLEEFFEEYDEREESKRLLGATWQDNEREELSKAVQQFLKATNCSMARFVQTLPAYANKKYTGFLSNLAKPLSLAYEQQHQNKTGRKFEGTAVLVVGEVRTGTREENVESIRNNVMGTIRNAKGQRIEVFAVLDFVAGDYNKWQYRAYPESMGKEADRGKQRIERTEVENMLKGYGAPFHLVEAKFAPEPDFNTSQCLNNPSGRPKHTSGQWLKVHAALQMMSDRELSAGSSFAQVVMIRPDVRFKNPIRFPDPGVPTVCRGVGGGGGDAVIAMERWAAPALEGMWRMQYDCGMPECDRCHNSEMMKFCIDHLIDKEACGHMMAIVLHRHGLLDSPNCISECFDRPGGLQCR